MPMNTVAARWREFGVAAFVALMFILMGVPPLPMLAAIGLVGLWHVYSYRREQSTTSRK
jgi:hypothetical protein